MDSHSIMLGRFVGWIVDSGNMLMIAELRVSSSVMHLILRLSKRRCNIDVLPNIFGFTALAIGTVIIMRDTFWLVVGRMTQYSMGTSHLIIDIWAIAISTVALKGILDVPVWFGILLNIAGIAVSMPLAMMFMRS